jgi:hypothetical protein
VVIDLILAVDPERPARRVLHFRWLGQGEGSKLVYGIIVQTRPSHCVIDPLGEKMLIHGADAPSQQQIDPDLV